MKQKFLPISLVLFVFSAFVFAQKSQVADQTQLNLRKHIEYLASDKLEGRRTGEPGANLASQYIAKLFAQYRLMPGSRPTKGAATYLQPFPYITGVEPAKTGNSFKLQLTKANGQNIAVENMTPVRPVGFSPNGEVVDAPIVFAGFGIVSQDPKFDDFENVDARGKVVIVFDGYPDYDNPHSQFARFDARTKALIARDKGAVGVLLISRETNLDNDRLAKMKFDQTLGEAALPTFVISRNTAANILGINEEKLTMAEGFTAAKATPGATSNVNFPDTAAKVSYKVNLVKKTSPAYNVVGILPGTDPELKGEAIIIGSHYDHLGRGGQGSLAPNSTEIHHGADDNASGVAAILELARRFSRENKNKRTIIFMAFSGEEEGLLGSQYYVNNPAFLLDKTVAMINLDMVGRLKDDKLTIGGMGTASEWNKLIVGDIIKAATQISPTSMSVPDKPAKSSPFTLQLNEDGFGPSDHSSFYGKKIPVLFFFTGTHGDYHKPSDTADKINYAGEENVISFIATITKAIDQNPQRPTYTVAKSSGTTGGRTGFNISLGTIPNYADSNDGLVLDGVRDSSPAAKAGLQAGDKVVKLAGKDIRNISDYTYILGEMKPGEEYEVVVIRGTERLTMKIVPVRRQ